MKVGQSGLSIWAIRTSAKLTIDRLFKQKPTTTVPRLGEATTTPLNTFSLVEIFWSVGHLMEYISTSGSAAKLAPSQRACIIRLNHFRFLTWMLKKPLVVPVTKRMQIIAGGARGTWLPTYSSKPIHFVFKQVGKKHLTGRLTRHFSYPLASVEIHNFVHILLSLRNNNKLLLPS